MTLTLLAASLPLAARTIAGPPGATVHIKWQPTVTESERHTLETRFALADGEQVDQHTWRYDLLDPSPDNIRAIVIEPAVADTNDIDRPNGAIDAAATRTARRQRFPAQGDRMVAIADGLAITLAAVAALLTLVGGVRRLPATRALWLRARQTFQSPADSTLVDSDEDRSSDRPRLWTAAVLATVAPILFALVLTLWQTPFPITEAVALFEDLEEQPSSHFLGPYRHYYRPLYYLTISAFMHSGVELETALAWTRLLVIVPTLLLVVLFIWHLRPRTAIDAAAAGLAAAVLMGSPGFRENLEIGSANTLMGMSAALLTWVVLNREWRIWHTPLIVICTLIAIGFKEQGLALVPLVIAAWWTRAPGASRGMAVTIAVIGVAYVLFRLSGRVAWLPFEQDIGLGFGGLDKGEAAARFGAFPYWIYAYNGASTIGNILFAEPTSGIFVIVRTLIEGQLEPWHVIHLASSVALTAVIAWWGLRCLPTTTRSQWSPESRLFVVMVLVVLATGALSFNYSRERLAGIGVVFYALAAFFAVRAAALQLLTASRIRCLAAGLGLALLAVSWQTRTIHTLEWTRDFAWRNQREWFVTLPIRRVEFAHRKGYVRIMNSMVGQGTAPAVPRATRFPDWVLHTIGEP